MKNIDFFTKEIRGYVPRTPSSAIKAYEAGLLPIEHFIYKSTSTNPLDEHSFSFEELERIIAREDMDLSMNRPLYRILEQLLKNRDPEIALFAAECINLIELRYISKIENMKKEFAQNAGSEGSRKLARLYFELAVLNERRIPIKKFYLKESLRYMKGVTRLKGLKKDEIEMLVKILNGFDLFSNSMEIVKSFDTADNDPFYLLLQAEIEFHRHNFNKVHEICRTLKSMEEKLTRKQKDLVSYWLEALYPLKPKEPF
ncbi:MAG: hypothetical protein JW969_11370 [Spirochaetales bacterium]|nr:hypothetical protein [Spirochaetales bacterium]